MTTDADALLAACDAAPAADHPRLVFADYLDDHGHPTAAEVLRVGVRLSRLVGLPPAERKRLSARRQELWRDYQREYAGVLAETGVVAADFARGLPNRLVTLPARLVLGRATDWWPVPAVRELDVTGLTHTHAALLADPLMPPLAELALGVEVRHGLDMANFVSDDVVRALAGCDRLARLGRLRLGLVNGRPELFRALAEAPWAGRLPGDRLALTVRLRVVYPAGVTASVNTLLTGRPTETAADALRGWLAGHGDRLEDAR